MTLVQADPMHTQRFAPGWPLWLFTLTLLPLLIWLGIWQLDRAEQKRALQAQIDASHNASAQPLVAFETAGPPAWQPLLLSGQFDVQHVWLLDNRLRDGQPGVEVLQVFHDQASDRRVLVNRGWLYWLDRSQLPAIATPQGQIQLQVERLPDPERGFTLNSPTTAGWPKLVGSIDLPAFTAQANISMQPWLVRLQPGSASALRLDWPPMPMSASKHTGYAVQWFAMAAMLLILFIWAGLRPVTSRESP